MSIYDELDAERRMEDLRGQIQDLRAALVRSQRETAKAQDRGAQVAQAVQQGAADARLALGPVAPVPAPEPDLRERGEHHAIIDFGDWQGTKVTTTYNTAVMQTRVRLAMTKIDYFLAEQRKSRPVRHATVILGGDMIEGLWNYPTQAWEVEEEPIGQVIVVAHLIAEVMRWALGLFETVTVVPEWGNHGRVGSKRDGVPKHTNLDRMTYLMARQECMADVDAGRLIWEDSIEDIQRLVIGNYRALVLHGDEIGRSGFASPSTIVGYLTRLKSGAYKVDGVPWAFQDAYLHHYHTAMEMTLPDGVGRAFWNGSTESDNRYARDTMAAAGLPTQRLHFVDPDRGLVVQRVDILLEEA
jgi:hypothetical protein